MTTLSIKSIKAITPATICTLERDNHFRNNFVNFVISCLKCGVTLDILTIDRALILTVMTCHFSDIINPKDRPLLDIIIKFMKSMSIVQEI